jgi:hypothetical protein
MVTFAFIFLALGLGGWKEWLSSEETKLDRQEILAANKKIEDLSDQLSEERDFNKLKAGKVDEVLYLGGGEKSDVLQSRKCGGELKVSGGDRIEYEVVSLNRQAPYWLGLPTLEISDKLYRLDEKHGFIPIISDSPKSIKVVKSSVTDQSKQNFFSIKFTIYSDRLDYCSERNDLDFLPHFDFLK